MLVYNPKSSKIYQAIKLNEVFPLESLPMAENICWLLSLSALGITFTYSSSMGLGMFLVSSAAAAFILDFRVFFRRYLSKSHPKFPLGKIFKVEQVEEVNVADYFDFETLLILNKSDCSFDAFFEISDDKRTRLIFDLLGIDFKNIEKLEKKFGKEASPDIYKVVYEAMRIGAARSKVNIEFSDLLLALARLDPCFNQVLFEFDLDFEDVENIVWREETGRAKKGSAGRFERLVSFFSGRGIGKDWGMGYTPTLDKYAREMGRNAGSQDFKDYRYHLLSHEKYINEMENLLSISGKNNVLIMGESGVGKRSLVHGLAERIYKGKSLPLLRYKRVMEMDTGAVLAGLSNPGEIEARVRKILEESVRAGNVILFVNHVHNILGAEMGVGKVDLSELILPYANRADFQLIGTTTLQEFHEYMELYERLSNSLKRIIVQPATTRETVLVLEELALDWEKSYGLKISYKAIKQAVFLTERYIQTVPFPQKAIDLMEEILSHVATETKNKIILPEHVNEVFSKRANISVGQIEETEKEKLLKLEDFIHQRVVNQEEAVKVVSEAMRRARTGTREVSRPIGSFLFLGPTGVGKTETAKALAEAYFGSDKKMIRLDMTEYQDVSSINKLIGSRASSMSGVLTSAVRGTPFSLLLLDEIEKAHPDILNLFLQVMDEGWLSDDWGRKVYFSNIIIIGTSNAGAEFIRQNLLAHKKTEEFKSELLDFLQRKALFKPEFLNRFDAIVTFGPLSKDHLMQVAQFMINKLSSRLAVEKDIKLVVTEETMEEIVRLGYDPVFGARPMRRVIQQKIENVVADRILRGQAERGVVVTI